MKKRIPFLLVTTMLYLASCAAPVRNFTSLEFNKIYKGKVGNPEYKLIRFEISSKNPIPDLGKAKATLMFQNLSNGKMLPERYELKTMGNSTLTTKDSTDIYDIENKKGQNLLFIVKFEYKNMIFYSNPKRVYYVPISVKEVGHWQPPITTPLNVNPPPENRHDSEIIKPVNYKKDILSIVYQLNIKDSFLDSRKGYSVYRLLTDSYADADFITFGEGRFKTTQDEQDVESVVLHLQDLFRKGNFNGESIAGIVICGEANLNEAKSPKIDRPHFNREKVFLWNSEQDALSDATYFTRTDLNYGIGDLPILRAVELKTLVQQYLGSFISGIDQRIFAVYKAPKDEGPLVNRSINVYVVAQPE